MSALTERVGILASGDIKTGEGGSTADRFIRDALEQDSVEIAVVVCNNPEGSVGVYDKVEAINRDFGFSGDDHIDVVHISKYTHAKGQQKRGQSEEEATAICELFDDREVTFGIMLGYMVIATTTYLEEWCWKPEYATSDNFVYRDGLYHPKGRTSNNHPAILPFAADKHGEGAHEKSAQLRDVYGMNATAMTWQLTAPGVDQGPTIQEIAVPTAPDDTPETISDAVQNVEKENTHDVIVNHLRLRAAHLAIFGT